MSFWTWHARLRTRKTYRVLRALSSMTVLGGLGFVLYDPTTPSSWRIWIVVLAAFGVVDLIEDVKSIADGGESR